MNNETFLVFRFAVCCFPPSLASYLNFMKHLKSQNITLPVFWISRCKSVAPHSRLNEVVVVFQLVLETNQFESVCLLVSRLSGRLSAEFSSLRHAGTSVSV